MAKRTAADQFVEILLAAGVRRIEAFTGKAAFDHMREHERILDQVGGTLKATPETVVRRVQVLVEERRSLERRLEETTGLSRGAIFHHFDDKDALFLALAHDDAAAMAATVAEPCAMRIAMVTR